MPTLHLLGTGAALTDPHRTTTMLAWSDDESVVVCDCGGDVVQRLLAAGLDLARIDALVVTHEHPDHVSGFPLFMERIWLAGRRRPIDVYGIRPAIEQARRCFEAFDTSGWTDMPEIRWHEIAHREDAPVLDDGRWTITASPGVHGVPVVGLRVRHRDGGVVAYSCDTAPCDAIERLAHGADILVHEATGSGSGHSSAAEAAGIARRAGARRLLLVHLPPDAPSILPEATAVFADTKLGGEGAQYAF